MNDLIRRLVINALGDLNSRYGLDGCNDLFHDDPLLKNMSEKDIEQIKDRWLAYCPDEAKECNEELNHNMAIVNMLLEYFERNY